MIIINMEDLPMEGLPKDVLYSIAMELDCPEVLGYCLTNKRIYEKVCNNIHFMRNKLKRDFDFVYDGTNTRMANYYYDFLCTNQIYPKRYNMKLAIKEGNKDLVDYFLSKGVALNGAMYDAAILGNKDFVEYFVSKGANDWHRAIKGALMKRHPDLIEYFKAKLANN